VGDGKVIRAVISDDCLPEFPRDMTQCRVMSNEGRSQPVHAKAELYSSSTFDGTPTCDRRSDTDGQLRVIPR